MKNKILLSLLLFTSVIVHAPARSPAPFQMLIGEWHSTSTTLNGEAIDFKWIFTPGFNENTLEFHSWIKQKEDSDWAPNTQALYVFDSKSNAFYAIGIIVV